MKKIIVMGLTSLLASALVFVMVGSLVSSNHAEAEAECEEIEATITSALTSPTTTAGTIEGDLEGTTGFTILNPFPGVPTATTISYSGNLVVTTEDGTLTTFGIGVFTPLPNEPGTQFDKIISGTGEFQGATGLLFFNFVADDTGFGFTSDVRGHICTADDDDDDDDNDDD